MLSAAEFSGNDFRSGRTYYFYFWGTKKFPNFTVLFTYVRYEAGFRFADAQMVSLLRALM